MSQKSSTHLPFLVIWVSSIFKIIISLKCFRTIMTQVQFDRRDLIIVSVLKDKPESPSTILSCCFCFFTFTAVSLLENKKGHEDAKVCKPHLNGFSCTCSFSIICCNINFSLLKGSTKKKHNIFSSSFRPSPSTSHFHYPHALASATIQESSKWWWNRSDRWNYCKLSCHPIE